MNFWEMLWVRGFLWAFSTWLKHPMYAYSVADLTWYCSNSSVRVPAWSTSGPSMWVWTCWVNAGHFEMGLENSCSLRHTFSTHTSHVFLQVPALHLCWSPIWMLFLAAVLRGYCLCLLEDLFYRHSNKFAGHNHNSLNTLKAFKQAGAF